MKKIKDKSGITLIALVVTIIVLLILAGISIMMLTRRQWNTNKCIKGRGRKCIQRSRRTNKISLYGSKVRDNG